MDLIEYLNDLHDGVLQAYTGIVQGLKGDETEPSPDVNLLEPHVAYMVQFITMVAQDSEQSDNNISSCSGLVG